MKKSKIEWTDTTWNVSTGCTQISPACKNCYAKAMTKRLQGMAKAQMDKKGYKCEVCGFDFVDFNVCVNEDVRFDERQNEVCCVGNEGCLEPHKAFTLPKYAFGFDKIIFHHNALPEILDTKKYPSGNKVFVNSMSDLFHEKLLDRDISKAFRMMIKRKDLIFQVLTKRSAIMYDFFNEYANFWENKSGKQLGKSFKHIWLGVTAENQAMADKRIPDLLAVKKILGNQIKVFVSIEPMLESINLIKYLPQLDWVICGGEKIPNNPQNARRIEAYWVQDLKEMCDAYKVPFFFKQWGSTRYFFHRTGIIGGQYRFEWLEKVENEWKEFPKE